MNKVSVAFVVFIFTVCDMAIGDSDKMAHMQLQPLNTPPTLEIVSRLGYSLGYDKDKRQPLWVAYRMKKEDLSNKYPRDDSAFRKDYAVSNSPDKYDYSGSGFDRGHMAPANDMEYHYDRMIESFYMSNMSPQHPHINAGAWRSAEKFARDAARRFGEVYVVSGPIFAVNGGDFSEIPMPNEKEPIKAVGGDIPIPVSFYKVIYTKARGGLMIAFQIDNDESLPGSYLQYARSVRRMEFITGLRFFPDVDPDEEEGLRDLDDVRAWF